MFRRLPLIREALGKNGKRLSQRAFGQGLSISDAYVNQIETGKRPLNDRIAQLICLTYNVSEDWLRTGKGEMFLPSKKSGDDLDAFRRVLKAKIQALPPEGQSLILELCKDIEAAAKSPGQEEPEEPD